MAGLTDKNWHSSAAAPVAVVRRASSSCPSVLGGLTPAATLDEQFTR